MSAAIALVVLLSTAAVQESEGVALRCSLREGALVVEGVPMVLDDEEVARHLRSGLTTTLELTLEARSGSQRARAIRRIQVRYEPWEEVYYLRRDAARAIDPDPRSLAGLRDWWRDLDLAVELPTADSGRRWRATLEVEVVPFSEAEREDAQRWLARSDGGGDSADGATSDGGEVGTLLELVMATGIDRRAILGSVWRLDCPSGEP